MASLGTLGLGQLYNGKHRKAIIMYGLAWVGIAIGLILPPAASFSNLVILSGFAICIGAAALVDSIRDAHRLGEIKLNWYNRWYVYLVILLAQGLVIGPVSGCLLGLADMEGLKARGEMMLPTLREGDRFFVDQRAYNASSPSRGDIVIFKHPEFEGKKLIMRIIGLPGEKVSAVGQEVFVNGELLAEPWSVYPPQAYVKKPDHGLFMLGADEYFLMSDNKDKANRRHRCSVHRSQIMGQVRYLYWAEDKSRIGKHIQ